MSFGYEEGENLSYKVKVKAVRVLFPKSEADFNGWSIVSVKPVETELGFKMQLNAYANCVVRGNMPMRMIEGQDYELEVTELKSDSKYGDFYEVVKFKVEELNTIESQQKFLESVIHPTYATAIIKEYPNIMLIDGILDGTLDLTQVHGIGDKIATKIKNTVDKNKDMGALMAELVDLNFTSNMLKRIIDKFGGASLALQKAKDSLYNLCYVSGISFKRVDTVALKRGEDRFGSKRIKAYCEYSFDEIANQGHSWVNERVFLEKSIADLDIIATYVKDYFKTEEGQKYFIWDKEKKRVSSMRMYTNERNTLKHLLRIASTYQSPSEDFDMDESIELAEEKLGLTYTDEQRMAIKESFKHGVFVLNGKGGTGKTTIMRGIVEVFNSLNKTYKAYALSGKASNVLSQNGINSATMHRTFSLGVQTEEDDNGIVYLDGFINDESSMVNAGLFATTLAKIPSGSKIIIVGDSGQLSGIGHGDVLRDLLRTKYFPTVELQQIHRQAKDSGIIEVASKIRDGEKFISSSFNGKSVYGINKDMVLFGYQDKEQIPHDLLKILKAQASKTKNPRELMDFQVVVAIKERGDLSAKAVNILAQSVFNDLNKPSVAGGGYDYREGDKVIVKGNSYDITYYDDLAHYDKVEELRGMGILDAEEVTNGHDSNGYTGDLFNGTMGIVKEIIYEYDQTGKKIPCLAVEFDGLGLVVLPEKGLDILDLAYAVTCHRLQGSTIKNVIVVLDYSAYNLLSMQWLYTAITRASKKCVVLGQTSAMVKALNTDASGNRQTFLEDLILEVSKQKGALENLIAKAS